MHPPRSTRLATGAAILIATAAATSAAAVAQLRTAGAEPGAPASPLPYPAARAAPPRPVAPRGGGPLEEARARLRRGGGGPAGEVDRWAVRLARLPESRQALSRYARYRPLIREALRAEGLPLDLAFVPWVESGWRNEATSRAGAAGMWQFMAATARAYGLEVSRYVDERRDPVRSTYAAARHLADLQRQTGDWHATLAAYNAGIGRAGRTRGAFWSRRGTLPAETRAYVPRVLAAARVGRDPAAWGLAGTNSAPLGFREVWTPGGTPLGAVARAVGAAPGAVRDLNPHLVRGTTPPGRRWPVRVPLAATTRGPSRRSP